MPNFVTEGHNRIDIEIEPKIVAPDIETTIQPTLDRNLGYDNANEKWRPLAVDTQGRLHINPSSVSSASSENLNTNVDAVGVTLFDENSERRAFIIMNPNPTTVYVTYGASPNAATGFPLPQNAILSDDIYTGIVTAVTLAGTTTVRTIEIF